VNARETNSLTTPLYAAAAFGRQEVVSTLLLWGADPNLVSRDQVSPLHAAESNNFPEIAKQLRTAGAH
jgi:ankyrin repeat protein